MRSEQRSPTGLTLWPVPTDDGRPTRMAVIWPGPGARLYFGIDATRPGGSMTPIDHPTADGAYMTLKDARIAARAFISAGNVEEGN